ncbi:hypothetical protein G6F57_016249 [Rhizopus arrhizus]|nr:hypothetical protein G6F57_016249 [Rhizopus arrhizus]
MAINSRLTGVMSGSGATVVVDHTIAFRVPTEGQRRDEGEAGEEEHQERRLAQAGPGDLVGHRVVAHRGVGQQHPQVADGGGQVPEAHHHALHRLRRLAVGELQAGGRDQYLTEGQQRVRQDLPEDRHGIAAVHHHLDATDDDPGQAAEGDTGGHAAQRGRLEAEAAQRRVQHQVVEGNQDHHQQRVQCLHLRGGEPARHLHLLALQDPRRGLLVEQREERRGQREDHKHEQHRAHAFHGFGRMLAAGTVQLQPGAAADAGQDGDQRKAQADDDAQRTDQPERGHGQHQAERGDHQARTALPGNARGQRGTHHVGERMRVLRRQRHQHVALAAQPEHEGGHEHQDARDAERPLRAP